MTRTLLVRTYGIDVRYKEEWLEPTLVEIAKRNLETSLAAKRIQRISDFTVEKDHDHSDSRPWRLFITCDGIKMGRRKEPYPLPEERLSWREIDLSGVLHV